MFVGVVKAFENTKFELSPRLSPYPMVRDALGHIIVLVGRAK